MDQSIMRKYLAMIAANKFTLAVSPPVQSIEYVEAALKGGADSIKLHCNVSHTASGNVFGTFQELKPFFKEVIDLVGDVPVGLVPGADRAFITEAERIEMEELGLCFFSVYDKHTPPYMMDSEVLTRMIAIHYDYDDILLKAIDRDPDIDVVEASFIHSDDYGKALTYKDILRYRYIAASVRQPVTVPTQKAVKACEVRYLYEAGCKTVMIGIKAMGEQSPEACLRTTAAFREAIDKL